MSKFDCVIYDFDGVILDTVQLKVDAFCRVYQQEEPDLVEEVRRFADDNGGVSRYEKFRYFELSLFGRNADPASIERLCASYGRYVDEGVTKAAYIKGAPECFTAVGCLAEQHIVSAAPENDVLIALRERNILQCFQSVAGAPNAKLNEFERVLTSSRLEATRVLAIGDSLAEYYAATQLGIPFLAIVGPHVKDRFPPDTRRMPDLTQVMSLL